MQGRTNADGLVSGADAFFMYDLFRAHPAFAAEKSAGQCSSIGYGINPEWPDTSSFYIVNLDGSKMSFSASKCAHELKAKAPSQKRKRELVHCNIQWSFGQGPRHCHGTSGSFVLLAGLPAASAGGGSGWLWCMLPQWAKKSAVLQLTSHSFRMQSEVNTHP